LEDGSKLRVDTTVVETDIHHPTDNTLLWDVVRVITRLVKQLAAAVKLPRIKGFCNRSRSAHRRMYEIQRMTTRQRQGAGQIEKYQELIEITEAVVTSAASALETTATMCPADLPTALKIDSIRADIKHYLGLGERVIDQARRRVLNGEQVPTAEKIYSIFEPHTDLIKRGKVRTPVEFGHKVFLAESAIGLITQYEVLKGNPSDEVHVIPSLQHHSQVFHRSPKLYCSDRGFFSEPNVAACANGGVATVSIPQRGGGRTPEREACERSRAFRDGQSFRAGIEGRISVLMRGRGMPRPRRRALRIVCWCCGTRQQSHEDRRAVDQTCQAPGQTNQQIVPSADRDRGEVKSSPTNASSAATNRTRRGYTTKNHTEDEANPASGP
jgi:IS5 family transposase